MADDFKVEVKNLAEVNQYLTQIPENLFDDTKKIFQTAVLKADKRVKSLFGKRLQSRTGMLRRSLRTSVTGTKLSTLKASFYSAANVGSTPVVYAPIHEYGGTIKAIDKYMGVPGGPYLNIPTGSNKTPAGVMKKNAKMIFNEGGYIQRSRKGNWGVFLGSKMMFVLVKKVDIKPQLSMNVSAERQIPTILSSLKELVGRD